MSFRVPPPRRLLRAPCTFLRRRQAQRMYARGRATIQKHPAAPRFWRNIAPILRSINKNLPAEALEKREDNWFLVLQAKAIPYRYFAAPPFRSLFVPPVAARAAVHEIAAFEGEKPVPPLAKPLHEKGSHRCGYLIFLLIFWHRIRHYAADSIPFLPPNPDTWPAIAGLDAYKVATLHEWWRAVTALTMHADAAHLLSNVFLGILFGVFLCAHTGVGFGALLTVLAGAVGNILTAYLRPAASLSLGFSTAVFAIIGLLAGIAAVRAAKHVYTHKKKNAKKTALKHGVTRGLLPLAAGLGLLAMFGGSDAPNVDYLAHVMGLFSGMFLGLAVALFTPKLLELEGGKNLALQWGSLFATAGLFIFCWFLALT